MTRIEEAISALKAKSIANPRVASAPTEAQIREAEAELGLDFPPSFRTFLQFAGAYQLPYWETYWVGDEGLGYRNIVEANRCERNEAEPALPPFLVAFHNNGSGDQLCFDTRRCDENGEYPIVFWDHEESQEDNLANLAKVATNFAEWLMEDVEEAD